mgnify:CR=1 FL=1
MWNKYIWIHVYIVYNVHVCIGVNVCIVGILKKFYRRTLFLPGLHCLWHGSYKIKVISLLWRMLFYWPCHWMSIRIYTCYQEFFFMNSHSLCVSGKKMENMLFSLRANIIKSRHCMTGINHVTFLCIFLPCYRPIFCPIPRLVQGSIFPLHPKM